MASRYSTTELHPRFQSVFVLPGATDGTRTRGIRHHKPALYRLSYGRHPEERDLPAAESLDPVLNASDDVVGFEPGEPGSLPLFPALHLRKPPGRTIATRGLTDLGIRDNGDGRCSSCRPSYSRTPIVSTRFSTFFRKRRRIRIPKPATRRRARKIASTEKRGFPYGSIQAYNPVLPVRSPRMHRRQQLLTCYPRSG